MNRIAMITLFLAACGGSKAQPASSSTTDTTAKTTDGAPNPDDLHASVVYLCESMNRWKADPKAEAGCWDPSAGTCTHAEDQVRLLGQHELENQKHPRVLAYFDATKTEADSSAEAKHAELQKLLKEAGVEESSCALAALWAPAKQ
jgi:hypothetical protein